MAEKETTEKKNKGGRPLLFKTVKELAKKIEKYFQSCFDYKRNMFGGRVTDNIPLGIDKETGKMKWKKGQFVMIQVKPYTVSGLAVFLNTSRETLVRYGKKDEFYDTIKRAKDIVYAYTEESLFTNKPTGPIFSLKNNYGWKDKRELDHTSKGKPISLLGGDSNGTNRTKEDTGNGKTPQT